MSSILITGGGGFLAAHVIEHFLQNTNYEIIAIDSFVHRGDPIRLQHLMTNPRLTIITADLSAKLPNRFVSMLQDREIEVIINTASESHVDRSITEPVSFVQNNVNLQLNVLELARHLKPKRFFQCSTDEVFGAAKPGISHKEWSPILPSNPYSASKAAQDAICVSYWRTYGVPITTTHTMNLIGERQDPEKFVPLVISKIMCNETIKIHGTSDYVGTRIYLHAKCLADAWLFLINKPETQVQYSDENDIDRPEAYNVCGLQEIDNLTLAVMISEKMGKKLKYELVDFHSARPGHDRRYALDGSKIASLGWKHPLNIEQSLDRIIKFYTNPANNYWLGAY